MSNIRRTAAGRQVRPRVIRTARCVKKVSREPLPIGTGPEFMRVNTKGKYVDRYNRYGEAM